MSDFFNLVGVQLQDDLLGDGFSTFYELNAIVSGDAYPYDFTQKKYTYPDLTNIRRYFKHIINHCPHTFYLVPSKGNLRTLMDNCTSMLPALEKEIARREAQWKEQCKK
eukprot:216863-Hanusia_phi.AAC.5